MSESSYLGEPTAVVFVGGPVLADAVLASEKEPEARPRVLAATDDRTESDARYKRHQRFGTVDESNSIGSAVPRKPSNSSMQYVASSSLPVPVRAAPLWYDVARTYSG